MNTLNDKSSSAIVAVSDIDQARRFYSDMLGLELNDEGMEGVLVYKTGATYLVVYPSEFAGTNKKSLHRETVSQLQALWIPGRTGSGPR